MTSHDWITLLAYEPRRRHAAARLRADGEAKRLDATRSRVLAELRRAVALDIEGFIDSERHRSGLALRCENGESPEGFVVWSVDDRAGTTSLAVNLDAGTLTCRYDFRATGIRAAHRQQLAVDIGQADAALSLHEDGRTRRFDVEALSAFLLAPMLGS